MTTTKSPSRRKPAPAAELQANALYSSTEAAIEAAKAAGYSVWAYGNRKVAAVRSADDVRIMGGPEDARRWASPKSV